MKILAARALGVLALWFGSLAAAQVRPEAEEPASAPLRLTKAPESPAELWDAVKFSVNVGRRDDALGYLKRLLASDLPADLLLQIRERDGAAFFPKLAATPDLLEPTAELIRRADQVAQARARDPERIAKFIGYLKRSAEHRAYGLAQLRAAGADAVPYLLAALQSPSLAEQHGAILQAMARLDTSAVPPLVAALDSDNHAQLGNIVWVLGAIGTRDTVPHLRYVAEAPGLPDAVRARARGAVEQITERDYTDLPSAADALVAQARRYYEHRVDLHPSASGIVRLWRWGPREGLRAQEVSPSYAEEYFGVRHASQALTLAPGDERAQILLVSLALEQASQRAGIDQPLPAGPGRAFSAALMAGPELLTAVLVHALDENRPAVALGALRAIGATGNTRALASEPGRASPLARALTTPDRRVQLAAADAILRIRPQQPYPGTSLVVPILARALSTDAKPQALVIDYDTTRAGALAALLEGAGYEARALTGAREGFGLVAESAGYELVFMDPNIQDPTLSTALANFRADPRTAGTPIAVTGDASLVNRVSRLAARYPRVKFFVRPETPEMLKVQLDPWLATWGSMPLTAAERVQGARLSALWLERIARGEIRGMDVRVAEPALLGVLGDAELGPHAMAAAARLPSPRAQGALAALALDGSAPPPLRLVAAEQLETSLHSFGVLLPASELAALADLAGETDDAAFHGALAAVLGASRPATSLVSERLRRFAVPPYEAAAASQGAEDSTARPPTPGERPAASPEPAAAPADSAGVPAPPVEPPPKAEP